MLGEGRKWSGCTPVFPGISGLRHVAERAKDETPKDMEMMDGSVTYRLCDV